MSIDRLRAHWGLSRMPFGKDLAPSMLHAHRSHAEATARIAWCIDEQALGVVTGEVGAGKTVAARAAIAALDTSRHTVIYIGNPAIGARGLYAAIVTALGGTPRFHKAALIPQATDALAAELNERGKRVVLVLDEAHLLDADQLEELRLLTNADMDSRSPGAVLLVGQPTLRRRIKLAPSQPSINASPCAMPWPAWTPPRPAPTSSITSNSPAALTPCSPATPSR